MRSLAMLSASTPVVATAAAANSASRPRALVAPAQLPRRPVVAAAFAVAAAAGAERRGVVVSVAAAPSSRRSVRVSATSDEDESDQDTSSSSGNNDSSGIVDRGPPHQVFYEDARNALAAFQQAGDDESLAALSEAVDSLGGAAADAASLAAAAESRAEAAEAELESAKDSLLRLRAEFENFRRRSEGEKTALAARAKAEAVEALVPLADSFDAAAALLASAAAAPSEGGAPALDENSPAAKVASAYGGLQKQLLDAFRGVGVTPVPGAGSPFDPNVHEAVMRELDDSVPDGTVLQEFRRGYAMGDRLVRAAMVKVSYTEGDGGAAAGAGAEAAVAGGGGSESE